MATTTTLLHEKSKSTSKTMSPSLKAKPSRSPFSTVQRPLKSLSRRLGFTKRSNLILFLALATTLIVFIIKRANHYLTNTPFCNPFTSDLIPSECYYYTLPYSRSQLGIIAHLSSVIPGSLLAVTQFIPAIRTRTPKIHRWIGYATWTCGAVAIVSALLMWDTSFGGTTSAKASIWLLAIITTVGHIQAYRGIKGGDIASHRAWMLRTWAQFGSIVTMRPLMGVFAIVITLARRSGVPGEKWYGSIDIACEAIYYMLNEGLDVGDGVTKVDFWETYGAACAPVGMERVIVEPVRWVNGSLSAVGDYGAVFGGRTAEVMADLFSPRVELLTAALDLAAGPAVFVAILLHAVAAEGYLWWSKEEGERLRRVGEAKRKAKARVEGTSVVDGDHKVEKKANGHAKEPQITESKEAKGKDEELSKKALGSDDAVR